MILPKVINALAVIGLRFAFMNCIYSTGILCSAVTITISLIFHTPAGKLTFSLNRMNKHHFEINEFS